MRIKPHETKIYVCKYPQQLDFPEQLTVCPILPVCFLFLHILFTFALFSLFPLFFALAQPFFLSPSLSQLHPVWSEPGNSLTTCSHYFSPLLMGNVSSSALHPPAVTHSSDLKKFVSQSPALCSSLGTSILNTATGDPMLWTLTLVKNHS